jgi:hypothetical protein
MEALKTQDSQSNPEQKEQAGSITISDFKLYYSNKNSTVLHKNKHVANGLEQRTQK